MLRCFILLPLRTSKEVFFFVFATLIYLFIYCDFYCWYEVIELDTVVLSTKSYPHSPGVFSYLWYHLSEKCLTYSEKTPNFCPFSKIHIS